MDYLKNVEYWNSISKKVLYTGPIDALFDYKFGPLEYKTTQFFHKRFEKHNYQGCAVMNFTDFDTKYTRIIEHKHFENVKSDLTWVSWEYPTQYDYKKSEAFYPVNDFENNKRFSKYQEISREKGNLILGGRLAEYKYFDMHQIIESALLKSAFESKVSE